MQYRQETLFEYESTQDSFVDMIDFLADVESDYDEDLDLERSGCTDTTTLFSTSEEQNYDGLQFGEIDGNGESSTQVVKNYSFDPSIPVEAVISKPRMPPARRKSSPDTFQRPIDDVRQEEPPRRKSANIPMPISRSTFASTENDADSRLCFDLALFMPCEQIEVPRVPESIHLQSLDWPTAYNQVFGAAPSLPDTLGERDDLNELMNLNNETVASSTVTQSDDWCSLSRSSVEPGRKRCRRKEPMEKEYVMITDKDVLLGRGGYSHHHPGNRSYRKLILENQKIYKRLENNEKTALSRKIVDNVKESGGRFLKRDDDAPEQMYYIVHDVTARLKVSQALREDHTPDGRRLKKERTSLCQR